MPAKQRRDEKSSNPSQNRKRTFFLYSFQPIAKRSGAKADAAAKSKSDQ